MMRGLLHILLIKMLKVKRAAFGNYAAPEF